MLVGHVYAIGGRSKDDNGSRLVSVERYDGESDSGDEIAPMKFFCSWLAAVPMDDNSIYALGKLFPPWQVPYVNTKIFVISYTKI